MCRNIKGDQIKSPVCPAPDRLNVPEPGGEETWREARALHPPAQMETRQIQSWGELLSCSPDWTQENGQVPESPTPQPLCSTVSGKQIWQQTKCRLSGNLPSSLHQDTAVPKLPERAFPGFQPPLKEAWVKLKAEQGPGGLKKRCGGSQRAVQRSVRKTRIP